MTVPKTRSSFPRIDAVEHDIMKSAMLDNLHIVPKPRPTHLYDLAARMTKDIEITDMHFEYGYFFCEVVSPDDGRTYIVKIYPPKD
ncbi:MAG: hypothetical protein KGJ13_02015 [Patescibacteria group bacterium]|nr:hypothetical protein [Patescibacteria group bacterium]